MTPHVGLDPRAILVTLGITDVGAVTPIFGGQDTAIWRVGHGEQLSALRVFRAEQARACRREIVAMRTAADGGIPVPEIRVEGMWEGRPALLLAWCAGRTLLDALKAQPWRVWPLGVQFGRMQARIHRVQAPDTLRDSPHRWIDWAGPVDDALRKRLLAIAGHADALVHFDYHPLNVLTDGSRVTAVLDWPNARAGDPRADLARTEVILRFRPGLAVNPIEAAIAWLLLNAWKRGYRQVAGRVTNMAPFFAWAGATTVHDLSGKIGQPGRAFQSEDLDPLRRWTARWMRRARL